MTPPRASSIFPRDQEGSAQARRTAPGRKVAPLPELRDVTITEYGERWLQESASRPKTLTLRSYTGLFRSHVGPAFAQLKWRSCIART